jgi:FtsP/CotA-like multicopper oxidase with cupredoxin domain
VAAPPGTPPGTTVPVVTGASVRAEFDQFFGVCERKLKADNLLQWPATWAEMSASGPGATRWLRGQIAMLTAYDNGKPPHQPLLPIDQMQERAGEFPQYYIGSFPYCFQLPRYTATSFPPPAGPPGQKVLQMGQSPGTMWYHAHKHGSTSMDVSNGMTGAMIIEDNTPVGYDGAIKAYYLQHPNDRKRPGQTQPDATWPILQSVMVVNQIAGIPELETGGGSGRGPNAFSINGQTAPNLTMKPGEVQMWRIINASPISAFYLPGLPAGFSWQQTAQDGVQFSQTNFTGRAQQPVYVAPGNRIDLLVQAPAAAGQTYPVYVVQGRSKSTTQGKTAQPPPGTNYQQFLNVVVAGSTITGMDINLTMPARPVFLNDIADSELPAAPAGRRTLNFNTYLAATGAAQHSISVDGGKQFKFSDGPNLKIPQLGGVEEWKITNDSNARVDHPFHIHINPFQVLEVFDPNGPLTDATGKIQFDTTNNPVPLYVFTGTCVANQNGNGPNPVAPCWVPYQTTGLNQCLLDGTKSSSWHPCGTQAPVVVGSTKNIWWDVFPIPDGKPNPSKPTQIIPGYFTMRTRFEDFKGSYVIHCHMLAHEDRGMMLEVDLATDAKVPMQHH